MTTKRALTAEEYAALKAYAETHGRTWKAQLQAAWMSASEPGVLQQLRNAAHFGPRGLAAFRFAPKVTVVARPYVLTFQSSGNSYPTTSEDAQRLIDGYPVLTATKYRVVLRGESGERCVLRPATVGGGPAFTVEAK